LDNVEHLLDGIELLDELLRFAPGVKILATTREPLNLLAEWVFEVQGLPVPANLEWDHLTSNSAVTLFIERAKQVTVSFDPAPQDFFAITRICQLVEVPLGLELAAAWVRTLSAPEIAQEIENSLDFLTTTARDLPPRHRSLRAVFDHSWSLLSDQERQVIQALSVFRGGFTREAVEKVANAALPSLSALVDKSLVRHSEGRRYDLHELVRQYTATHLQAEKQEEQAVHKRHAEIISTCCKSTNLR
jgi:predicted ATPase